MRKYNRLPEFLALAAVALLGHSDTALAQSLAFSPSSVTLSISGPGATTSTSVFVSSTVNITGNLTIASVNTSDRTNWLCAQPTGGNGLTVSIGSGCAGFSSSQLQAGQTYTGQIVVDGPTQSNGTITGTLQVTLQVGVSSNPTLIAAVNPLNFSVQTGGSAPSQNDMITLNGGSVTVNSVSTSTTTGQPWLLASVGSSSVFVSVNPANLSSGNYQGTVTANTSGGSLPIQVNLSVGGIPTLTVSPTALNFAYQTGTGIPISQSISLTSNGTPVNVSVNESTNSWGQGWLIVSPTGQLTTPSTITVTVNPAGLPAGQTYSGSITVNSFGGAANGTVTIPVNLLVSNSPIIAANPSSLTFTAQSGGTAPSQNLQLTSSGASLPYTASASVSTPAGGNWLNLPTQSGTTNGTLIVSVNAAGLAAGTYTGAINVNSPSAGNPNLSIPITFNVTSGPVLQLNVPALSFAYEIGFSQPINQTVTIASTSGAVSYTATAQAVGGWLSVSPTNGTAPGTLVVTVSAAGLAANTYTGTITITPTSGANTSPQTLPVTLVVSNAPLLLVSPSSVTFNATAGSNVSLAPTPVAVTATDGSAIQYTVSSSTNGLNWLLLNQTAGTTPENIQVSANSSGLSVGTYTGTVTIRTSSGVNVANSPQTVAVTLNVTSNNTLSVNPSSLSFTQATNGSAPQPQTINVTSSGASSGQQITFSAAIALNQGQNWLTVNPMNGTTASALTVSANGAGLAPGTYTGQIVLSSPGVNSTTVNVTLTVGSSSGGGLPSSGSFAHIASAGEWTTTFTLVNTGTTVAQVQLNFFDSFGNALPLPVSFPQTGGGVSPATTSVSRTVNPGAQLIVATTGPLNQVTQTGWAQLFSNGTIEGGAVFSQQSASGALFEAVVPLETRTPNSFLFAYDNTSGYDTGVAVTNLSPQAANITVVIQDDSGNTLQTNNLQVPAMGHTQFELDQFYGVTGQRRGTVQFVTPPGGQISILGFRFNPTLAFSTIPILTK